MKLTFICKPMIRNYTVTFESFSASLAKLATEDCVRDIDAWMTVNMLKMNRDN